MTDLQNRLRKEITGTNVCVLSTTDIVSTEEPRVQKFLRLRDGVEAFDENYGLKAETVDEKDNRTHFWTTGVLEMALAMGFTVWIISTRKAVGPHDSWWTKLVPGMQTIMHGPNLGKVWKNRILKHFVDRIDEESYEELEEQLRGDDSGDGTYNTQTTTPFMVWALLSKLEWPLLEWTTRDFNERAEPIEIKRAEPEFWTGGLARLAAEGYIVQSPFFHNHMEGLNDEIIQECKTVLRERKAKLDAESGGSPLPEIDPDLQKQCVIRNGSCINCGNAAGQGEC